MIKLNKSYAKSLLEKSLNDSFAFCIKENERELEHMLNNLKNNKRGLKILKKNKELQKKIRRYVCGNYKDRSKWNNSLRKEIIETLERENNDKYLFSAFKFFDSICYIEERKLTLVSNDYSRQEFEEKLEEYIEGKNILQK